MSTEGPPDLELPEPIQPESTPLLPKHLVDLFIRPRRFFGGQLALGETPYALFVAWCYGATQVVDRIDQSLIRAELGRPRPGWEQFGPYITESWMGFWVLLLLAGSASALAIWWLGGWWFAVRLRWSGCQEPDRRLARLVMIYSAFVYSGPFVLLYVLYTGIFGSYAEAYANESLLPAALLIFPFWSIAASYTGARTVFNIEGWGVRSWFLLLPLVLYVSVFGLIAALFAFLPELSGG